MRRIISRHLGFWALAGALFIGLGVASAMPNQDSALNSPKERVFTPRAAQTLVQDVEGVHFGYRQSLAAGVM
ncbi:hypothetical protein [Minwuia sp.]|uniref:hypothetical protein n=1 Tax=Minwuia sp. TaxID=2493630 RepID=UPI003A92CBA2